MFPPRLRRDRVGTVEFPSPTGGGQGGGTTGAHTLETLEDAHRYNAWVFDRVKRALGNRVLELGCGTGTITQFLIDRELVVGLDVVLEYVEAARARFQGHSNVTILLHDITTDPGNLSPSLAGEGRGGGFDSALSVNVLEHIPDDLAALKAVYRLLEPGGSLTLLVPSHPFLTSPFDRAIGHYRRYTKVALRTKLEAAGFQVERLRRSNPVGALGWLINNRLLRRRRLGAVGIYDRMVPLLARIDRLAEPPIGLSLIAVARKPAR
jgi:SAM-dependent methyltransferase